MGIEKMILGWLIYIAKFKLIVICTMIINFLNINSGAIQSISTMVLVIVTIYYALQTKRTVKEMEETRKYDFLPILEMEVLQVGFNKLNIKISNIGKGLARSPKIFIPTIAPSEIQNIGNRCYFETVSTIDEKAIMNIKKDDRKLKIEYLDVFSRKIISEAIIIQKISNDNIQNHHLTIENWNLILPE